MGEGPNTTRDLERALERCRERLKQTEEELKALAYVVSHDLRAPLINLKGFSYELRASLDVVRPVVEEALPDLDEAHQVEVCRAIQDDIPESMEFIELSTSQLEQLVSSILVLSRLTRRPLQFETLFPGDVVQQAWRAIADEVDEKLVGLTVEPLPQVRADRDSLQMIFEYVLKNAAIYRDPDQLVQISVSGESSENSTVFHVRDTGRAIADRDMDKVFEPLRRGGAQDVPGDGMGMAYARTLVRRHDGRIWCTSEEGEGAAFHFTISKHLSDEGGGYAGEK